MSLACSSSGSNKATLLSINNVSSALTDFTPLAVTSKIPVQLVNEYSFEPSKNEEFKSPGQAEILTDILHKLKQMNSFPSSAAKEEILRMAYLSGLMSKEIHESPYAFPEADALFPNGLVFLPTPEQLKMQLPTGLKVQAYRTDNEALIVIRGTTLNRDVRTLIKNLLADLGIGRHKGNDEIVNSIEDTNKITASKYGYEINKTTMEVIKSIVESRITGGTNYDRAVDLTRRFVNATLQHGSSGAKLGAATSVIPAAVLGFCSGGPFGASLMLMGSTFVGGTVGAGVGALKQAPMLLTAVDGYETLLNYIKAIDGYVTQLKPYIGDQEIITVGHSLGGYLAGVIGAIHASRIYAFNAPGVKDEEVNNICKDLGIKQQKESPDYTSISMDGDFIGNLGKRFGPLQHLFCPKIEDSTTFGCFGEYKHPITLHGIEGMKVIITHSSIAPSPHDLTPRLTYKPDRNEERKDENQLTTSSGLTIEVISSSSSW